MCAAPRRRGVVVHLGHQLREVARRRRRRRCRSGVCRPAPRSTPMTRPNLPSRPAATPDSASSTTTVRSDGSPSRTGRRRRRSRPTACHAGRAGGPPRRRRRCRTDPRSRRPRARPARSSSSTPRPSRYRAGCSSSISATDPGYGLTPSRARTWLNTSFFRLPESAHGLRAGRVARVPLGQLDAAREQHRTDAVIARLAVDVVEVVGVGVRRLDAVARLKYSPNICAQACSCTMAVGVRTPSRSNSTASYSVQSTTRIVGPTDASVCA